MRVGDRLRFLAEDGEGCLPHAPFCFHCATGLHDDAHPCYDAGLCRWPNRIYPARTDSLAPHFGLGDEAPLSAVNMSHGNLKKPPLHFCDLEL